MRRGAHREDSPSFGVGRGEKYTYGAGGRESGSDEAVAEGGGGGGGAGGGAELGADGGDVLGGGAAGDEERCGDLLVRPPLDQQAQDVAFAGSEVRCVVAGRCGLAGYG